MLNESRPTWAEIHLDKLGFNFQSAKSFIGNDIRYMAVVKADAYGHGAIKCAERLEQEGADWFGVALPEEGVELRKNGIKKPILSFGFYEGQEPLVLENRLTPVIFRLELAKKIDRAAKERGLTADVHIKVDTGMNRVGVRCDEFKDFVEKLKEFRHLRVDGIMTHFANADDLAQNEFTNLQIKRFNESVEILREKGFQPNFVDLANSPGAVAHPASRGNMVRLGGILYGLGGDVLPENIEKPELKAVMSLHSKIALLKKVPKGETLGYSRTFLTERNSLIATIPIGYHDGYPRGLSNCGKVIINKSLAPVAGRVSMDWTILDVTDVKNVKVGDEVILIGECGDLSIKAEDLARQTKTISYEITCGLNQRVRKVYRD